MQSTKMTIIIIIKKRNIIVSNLNLDKTPINTRKNLKFFLFAFQNILCFKDGFIL